MNTKTIVALFESGEFDLEKVKTELIEDAKTLVATRKATNVAAIRACYAEQLQKYESAVKRYADSCAKRGIHAASVSADAMRVEFCKDRRIASILGHADSVEQRYNALAAKVAEQEKAVSGLAINIKKIFSIVIERLQGDAGDEPLSAGLLEIASNATLGVMLDFAFENVTMVLANSDDRELEEAALLLVTIANKAIALKHDFGQFDVSVITTAKIMDKLKEMQAAARTKQTANMLAAMHMLGATLKD